MGRAIGKNEEGVAVAMENSEKPNLIDNYKYYCHYIMVYEKPH